MLSTMFGIIFLYFPSCFLMCICITMPFLTPLIRKVLWHSNSGTIFKTSRNRNALFGCDIRLFILILNRKYF